MNVVDSSGWLEYFADGPNADFFASAIESISELLVPTLSLKANHQQPQRILSTDRHFDRLAEIERIDPHDFYPGTQSLTGSSGNPQSRRSLR